MYVELLNALEALNRAEPGARPLVDDLSLAVTGTDLDGDPVDVRLADGIAREYDHKHTFEFRLSSDADEFRADFDPLLAFAARTTSSLPAVFEPSTVPAARALSGEERARKAPWDHLFRSLREADRRAHERHAFADGGYLDNKPFGHAIDLLARAPTGVHVTRKLYYLEPQPQRIDRDAPPGETPNAVANTLKVVTLARYETIRADIERITERNRLLDRVRTLGFGVLEDVAPDAPTPAEGADLRVLTREHGPAYGGYHRLRVGTLTDDLADAVADLARVAPTSDLRRAIRLVVRAWRNAHFARNAVSGREPESVFLQRFDVPFHRRRAVFFLNKINQLFHLDDDVAKELENLIGRAPEGSFPTLDTLLAQFRGDDDARAKAHAAWSGLTDDLRRAKTAVSEAIVLLDERRPLTDDPSGLREQLEGLDPARLQELGDALRAILAAAPGAAAETEAQAFLDRHRAWVESLAGALAEQRTARIDRARETVAEGTMPDRPEGLAHEVRGLLELYWGRFHHFDMVQFALVEATGVGDELSPVEVHRMSPSDGPDAAAAAAAGPDAADKLMGTRFASFGAFLDRDWRASDIRWGRLDGAERLITTLLGREDAEARDALVAAAHLAILREEFPAERAAIDALAAPADGGADAADLAGMKARIARFLAERQPDPHLDPRASATTLSRLLRTGNKLVDTLTTESRAPRALRNAIGLTSLAGAELLEAAIPKSLKQLLVSYWANLFLLFGTLLIALAWLLPGGSFYRPELRLGLLLVVIGGAGLFVRSLLWRLVAPLAPAGASPGVVAASRRLGAAALVLGLLAIAGNVVLEWPRAWSEPRDLLGQPTVSMALTTARTGGEVACVLGASTAPDACVAPAGAPTGPAAASARGLVIVDFALVAFYVSVLALLGLAASRAGAPWLGILGIALAATAGVLDVTENARLLRTLATDYGAMDEAWLHATAQIARAKFLAVFAAAGVLIPTLGLHARGALLNVRMATWVLTVVGAAGVAAGMFGLLLGEVGWLAGGLGGVGVVTVGIAVMVVVGQVPRLDSGPAAP
jgi:patatin-related protein